MFVSPAEPPLFHQLGHINRALTEDRGVDFFWSHRRMFFGAQRKEFSDLISSIQNSDRLAREAQQIQRLDRAYLIIEGTPAWTRDGWLVDRFRKFTRAQYVGLQLSLQDAGFHIVHTDSMEHTVVVLEQLERWTAKEHLSLKARGGPTSIWGAPDNVDFQRWLLQGLPTVGPGLADAIIEHFGGLPMRWTCSREELLKVKGLGPKRIDKLLAIFGTENVEGEVVDG